MVVAVSVNVCWPGPFTVILGVTPVGASIVTVSVPEFAAVGLDDVHADVDADAARIASVVVQRIGVLAGRSGDASGLTFGVLLAVNYPCVVWLCRCSGDG